ILQRALNKSPADRFQTAEEFRDALSAATGMVMTDLAAAFSISIEEVEVTPAAPSAPLEHFGPTPTLRALTHASVLAGGDSRASAIDVRQGGSLIITADPLEMDGKGTTVMIPTNRRSKVGVSLMTLLAVGIATMLAVVAWRR